MDGFLAGLACLGALTLADMGDPEPVVNGYDGLIVAARQARGVGSDTNANPGMGPERLRGLVEPNRPALRMAREALSKSCFVPPEELNSPSRFSALIVLTQLFNAEGAWHESSGRFVEASGSYLDMIALSVALSHGGRLQDATSAVAASVLARQGLMRLRGRLPAEGRRQCIRRLEAIDKAREPLAALLIREDQARRLARPALAGRLRTALRLPGPGLGIFSDERFAIARETARVRLLAIDLAILLYRAERKREPSSLDDLVPGYLARVPADPFSSRDEPLRLAESASGIVAYSVGPDRIDDGGRPIIGREEPFARGDLLLSGPNRETAP